MMNVMNHVWEWTSGRRDRTTSATGQHVACFRTIYIAMITLWIEVVTLHSFGTAERDTIMTVFHVGLITGQ